MGSTISVARKVGAISAANGSIYYALFEKTYERNCYPHDPSWSAISFGRGPDAIRSIFNLASATTGGMLRRPGGRFTPIGYIQGWMKEIKSPFLMKDVDIGVEVVDDQYPGRGKVGKQQLTQILHRLRDAGQETAAQQLESKGEYTIDKISEEACVLEAILGGAMAWRFIDEWHVSRTPAPELGWNPPAAAQPPIYQMPGHYRLENLENIFHKLPDGQIKVGNWQYREEGNFVSEYGEQEVAFPGHWRAAMRQMKEHFENLPLLPEDAWVQVVGGPIDRGFEHCAETLRQYLPPEGGPISNIPFSERRNLAYASESLVMRLLDKESEQREAPVQRTLAI